MPTKTFLLLIFCIAIFSCSEKKTESYTKIKDGFFYRLLSFNSNERDIEDGNWVKLNAVFKTQRDSVFWDSYNNRNDLFLLEANSQSSTNFISSFISKSSCGDSVELLIKPAIFFEQIFKTKEIPFFSNKDTVVKVNFMIQKVISDQEYEKLQKKLAETELQQIKEFFGNKADFEKASDPLGFYWLELSGPDEGDFIQEGESIIITYQGEYLNGRFLERSPQKFEFIYGTPDQVLKGVNFVIKRLKLGQTAKIILPSRLAFGEFGSTNGTVPPYTPLVYHIKVAR